MGWDKVQTVLSFFALSEHLTVTSLWCLAASAELTEEEQMTWQLRAETLGWIIAIPDWWREETTWSGKMANSQRWTECFEMHLKVDFALPVGLCTPLGSHAG